MIGKVTCKDTKRVHKGRAISRWPEELTHIARRKLALLQACDCEEDLKRLRGLKVNMRGQYSLKVSNTCRISFRWADDTAQRVEMVDYHA